MEIGDVVSRGYDYTIKRASKFFDLVESLELSDKSAYAKIKERVKNGEQK